MLIRCDGRRSVDVGTSEEDLEEGDPEIAIKRAGSASRSQGEEGIVVLENPLVERENDGDEEAGVQQIGDQGTPGVGDIAGEMG